MSDISDFLDWISWIEIQGNQYELNKKKQKLQKLVTTLQNIFRGVDHFLQHKLGGWLTKWVAKNELVWNKKIICMLLYQQDCSQGSYFGLWRIYLLNRYINKIIFKTLIWA